MATEASYIVQRLWNYYNVLRDDGVSYGDYVEQLTFLLFLKMADEQTKPPFPENRFDRKEIEQFKAFTYDELMQRDKVSLDIFWLKDESLEDSENLPPPDIIAREIAENLESALEQFSSIYENLGDD
jgi:type I restriction-modification system DNA methylase subunit